MTNEIKTKVKRTITVNHSNPEDVVLKYYLGYMEVVCDEKGDELIIIDDPIYREAIVVDISEDNQTIDKFMLPYYKDMSEEQRARFLDEESEGGPGDVPDEDFPDEV